MPRRDSGRSATEAEGLRSSAAIGGGDGGLLSDRDLADVRFEAVSEGGACNSALFAETFASLAPFLGRTTFGERRSHFLSFFRFMPKIFNRLDGLAGGHPA
jgi:hypothetical protein